MHSIGTFTAELVLSATFAAIAVALDATSLVTVAEADTNGTSSVAITDRMWVGAFDGLQAIDRTGAMVVDVPWIYGTVGSSETTTLLFSSVYGLLRVDAS